MFILLFGLLFLSHALRHSYSLSIIIVQMHFDTARTHTKIILDQVFSFSAFNTKIYLVSLLFSQNSTIYTFRLYVTGGVGCRILIICYLKCHTKNSFFRIFLLLSIFIANYFRSTEQKSSDFDLYFS